MEAAASNNRQTPSRRRISGGERRESILALTSRAFAERGYDGVRTAELAKSAGVSEALIYQHFRTKAELYRAAVDRSADILQDRLTTAVGASGAAGERLELAVDAFLEYVSDGSQRLAGARPPCERPRAGRVSAGFAHPGNRSARRHAGGRSTHVRQRPHPRAARAAVGGDRRRRRGTCELVGSRTPARSGPELASLLTGFAWSGFEQLVELELALTSAEKLGCHRRWGGLRVSGPQLDDLVFDDPHGGGNHHRVEFLAGARA